MTQDIKKIINFILKIIFSKENKTLNKPVYYQKYAELYLEFLATIVSYVKYKTLILVPQKPGKYLYQGTFDPGFGTDFSQWEKIFKKFGRNYQEAYFPQWLQERYEYKEKELIQLRNEFECKSGIYWQCQINVSSLSQQIPICCDSLQAARMGIEIKRAEKEMNDMDVWAQNVYRKKCPELEMEITQLKWCLDMSSRLWVDIVDNKQVGGNANHLFVVTIIEK